MEIVLLIILLLVAYSIYGATEKLNESCRNLSENINQSLLSISSSIHNSIHNLSAHMNDDILNVFLKTPSNLEEIQAKKETLVKCYANFLVVNQDQSSDDAEIQAEFEVNKFGVKEILRRIDWSKAFQNQEAEEKFTATPSFKKQIENFWTVGWKDKRYINPFDLFRPIYAFIKKSDYKNGDKVVLNKYQDHNYYSFIENRALLYTLKKIGVIKSPSTQNFRDLFCTPFEFNSTDLDDIKRMINDYYSRSGFGHDIWESNEEFEKWTSEHEHEGSLFKKGV